MRHLLVVVALVAVLAPAAFATGQALDPRVPKLQQQIAALSKQQSQDRAAVADVVACRVAELNHVDLLLDAKLNELYQRITGVGVAPLVPFDDQGACARAGLPAP